MTPSVADLTETELMQFEYAGKRAEHYLRDMGKLASPDLAASEKLKIEMGKLADEELTRRGIMERYC